MLPSVDMQEFSIGLINLGCAIIIQQPMGLVQFISILLAVGAQTLNMNAARGSTSRVPALCRNDRTVLLFAFTSCLFLPLTLGTL